MLLCIRYQERYEKFGVMLMKKSRIYFIIIIAVFVLSGCKSADEQTFFIPTPEGTDEPSEDQPSESGEDTKGEETADDQKETDKPVFVGKTETKYVKLDDYDAILNIRTTPSKDGEIVGFLVHTEQVEVISIENGWASFVYQGEIRYVSSDFLVDKKPAYLTPPTATPKPTPTKEPDPSDVPPEI